LSGLADRIRSIVAPSAAAQPSSVAQGSSAAQGTGLKSDAADICETLGGEWRGKVFVVDRRWSPSATHGRERIGALAEGLERCAGEVPLFAGGAPARPPFVFFDLETTGLNGGAGTLAFLVGCGWFEPDGAFVTRQFLLTRHADERALLDAVAAELARAGALVSFNGKSFDAPLLEGRYLFHRIAWRGREMPHVDVLHPARRFWKARDGSPKGLRYDVADASPNGLRYGAAHPSPEGLRYGAADGSPEGLRYGAADGSPEGLRYTGAEQTVAHDLGGGAVAQPFRAARTESGCSLQTLEKQLVGLRRHGDVPGFEIPARYFQFVRSGDAGPLEAILEHNRLDLLTLAALTARLLQIANAGPESITDPREALALGHVYQRGGLDTRARDSYRRAIDRCRSPRGAYDPIRVDALRALALACRRARLHDDAAGWWRELVEMRACPDAIAREAAEALAIHHEHRVRDLTVAKAFALRNLEPGTVGEWTSAARHRLARIERKLEERSLKF
jgi:uncharacterized protein YprB with RNaseH-like and TPR domain